MVSTRKIAKGLIVGGAVFAALVPIALTPLHYVITKDAAEFGANQPLLAYSLVAQGERSALKDLSIEELVDLSQRAYTLSQTLGGVQQVDNAEPSGSADLQRIAKQALPYIAKELNLDRINLPDMRINSRDRVMRDGREYVTAVYNPLTNVIELDQPLATGLTATWAVVHELVHAQFYSQGPLGMLSELVFRNKTFNETFTDVVALEVLADQAMAGNLPAKQALLTTASSHFKIKLKEHEGEKLSDMAVTYGKNQADVIINALNGQEDYQGVKLDGLTTFLKTEFSAALQQKQ